MAMKYRVGVCAAHGPGSVLYSSSGTCCMCAQIQTLRRMASKQQHLEYNLDISDFTHVMCSQQNKCAACGGVLQPRDTTAVRMTAAELRANPEARIRYKEPNVVTFRRKDNARGYTKDNLVAVHQRCGYFIITVHGADATGSTFDTRVCGDRTDRGKSTGTCNYTHK